VVAAHPELSSPREVAFVKWAGTVVEEPVKV
jgi:starch phosphorylase